jgi:ankyrin repeat protein
MRAKRSNAVTDAELKVLFNAIVTHDRPLVTRLVVTSPALVGQALQVGASREDPASYFFTTISHYAYAGDTPLHLAAAAHAAPIAADLLSRGAAVTAKNRRGAAPLHYAADSVPGSGRWEPNAQTAVVQLLLTAGADPDATDGSGVSPLHRAVRGRCAAAVDALLAGGADARMKNRSGSTPLHLAVQTTGRGGSGSAAARTEQLKIIELLLRYGARSSDRNAAGRSVWECARAAGLDAVIADPA